MNRPDFDRFERAVDRTFENVNPGWLLLPIGLVVLLGVRSAIRSGRIQASYRHRWGYYVTVDIEREFTPIQFWIRVMLQLLFGIVMVFFGVRLLILG